LYLVELGLKAKLTRPAIRLRARVVEVGRAQGKLASARVKILTVE
jgi:hypothetical protein